MTGEMADFTNQSDPSIETRLYDYGGLLACRHCGKSGFHWEQLDSGQWRLADKDGFVHTCKEWKS